MRLVRWGFVFCVIVLALAMKAPVWYLFSRLADITGGTGNYRSMLIDQAIHYFNDWWLIGTTYTAHWMPVPLPNSDHSDMTNKYISEGVNGGLIRIVLFVSIIVYCFKFIGAALRKMQKYPFQTKFTLWSIGTILLMHVISFMSVNYFDNLYIFYIGLIATISSICGNINKTGRLSNCCDRVS